MLIRHATVSIALLSSINCIAQERPPRIGETPNEINRPKPAPAAPADKQAAEQGKKPDDADKATNKQQQAKQPVKRRAVPLVIDSMPGPTPPAAYGPVLTPQSTTPVPPSITPAPSTAPAIINRCDSGGCTDTNGVRYNGGVGTTLLGPQGRVCHNNGITVQC